MRNYLESPNWVDHLLDDFKDFMSGEIRFDDVCKKIESMEAESCSGFFSNLSIIADTLSVITFSGYIGALK